VSHIKDPANKNTTKILFFELVFKKITLFENMLKVKKSAQFQKSQRKVFQIWLLRAWFVRNPWQDDITMKTYKSYSRYFIRAFIIITIEQ